MKRKNILPIIIISIVSLTVAIAALVFFIFGQSKQSDQQPDITVSDSFFLKDTKANKYALFNKQGQRLTDFIYHTFSEIINQASVVTKDKEYAIIDSAGKTLVDFGKYKSIKAYSGLFKAVDQEQNPVIINKNGQVLYDAKDKNLYDNYRYKDIVILEDKTQKQFKVLDYNGQELLKLNKDDTDRSPDFSSNQHYASIFYAGQNYIFDMKKREQVFAFDSSDFYCINQTKENGRFIELRTCEHFSRRPKVELSKIIKDGKLYDLENKCRAVEYQEDHGLVCKGEGNKTYVLDKDLKIGAEADKLAYKDVTSYIKHRDNAKPSSGVDFYKDNKIVKQLDCRSFENYGPRQSGIYLLRYHSGVKCGNQNPYGFYNQDGELLFGKSFKRASNFDRHNLAVVSEDGQNYYLINLEGQKISADYNFIFLKDDYYVARRDKNTGLIALDGTELVAPAYRNVNYHPDYKNYAIFQDHQSNYVLYSLNTKKEILKTPKYINLNRNYVSYQLDGHTKYYTYEGQLFHEKED